MHGRISVLAAGLALALGGGAAGAVLVGGSGGDSDSASPAEFSLAAERAAEAEKVSRASARRALRVAQRARRIARRARSKSNESLATATAMLESVDQALADSAQALTASQQAEQDAANALQLATNTSNRVDSTQILSNTASGTATAPAGSTDFVTAPDGPSVTVTVPASGMIEVWASARIESDEGAVALFRDGQEVEIPGQEGSCALDNALFMTQNGPVTLSTPPSIGFVDCGTAGDAPSSMLFNQPPGQHTYELGYGDCGCSPGDDAVFSSRTLRIAPRL